MTSFQVTPQISEAIDFVSRHQKTSIEEKKEYQKFINEHRTTISLENVRRLSNLLRNLGDSKINWVHELLEGSMIALPEKKKKVFSPEYLKKKAELEREYSNREYQKMTRNVSQDRQRERLNDFRGLKDMNSQMSIGLNIIVTMATVFAASYWLFNRTYENEVMAVLAGLFGAIAAMLVEVWLFIIKGSRIDSHLDDKKKK